MIKQFSNEKYAYDAACCEDAIKEEDGKFLVSDCGCKENKELKLDDIKVTKEFKVRRDSK